MKKPILQGEAFLADVQHHRADQGTLHLWWLGQSGFLLAWGGHCALLDPYLSDSLTVKYADTDLPHVRITELVIDPQHLDFLNVISSSHNHTDHLDAATLLPLLKANPEAALIVPVANRSSAAERLQLHPERLSPAPVGGMVEAGSFRFHAVPAAHETRDLDDSGQDRYVGYVIEAGPWRIYHSGDTLWYEGMEDLLRPWRIDVALLPINGHHADRRVAGNLNGPEAARLAQAIGARMVIPCHYDMFEFNTASPGEFITTTESLGQPYHVMENGGHWDSTRLA